MKSIARYTALRLARTCARSDTLRVGRTDDGMRWTSIVESAQFVAVSPTQSGRGPLNAEKTLLRTCSCAVGLSPLKCRS